MKHRLVLLPGMHGTADLFAPLLHCAPRNIECIALGYPIDELLGYDQLFERLEQQIPQDVPFFLLGESFSGPLAIRYAAKYPGRVRGLILCVTFVRFQVHPLSPVFLKIFGAARPMDWVLRATIAGSQATEQTLQLVRSTLRRVKPQVIAHRLADVGQVDVREQLRRCEMPVLYLRGACDRVVRATHFWAVHEHCPDLRVETIRAPHLLLQSQPCEAWNRMRTFITEKV
jgi:pimeloyl-[acyl-carrier protein] methyl ester esterase